MWKHFRAIKTTFHNFCSYNTHNIIIHNANDSDTAINYEHAQLMHVGLHMIRDLIGITEVSAEQQNVEVIKETNALTYQQESTNTLTQKPS